MARSGLMLGVTVALSVAVVVGVYVAIGRPASRDARTDPSAQQVAQAGGIRPAEVDPAGRVDLDPGAGDATPALVSLPGDRPAGAGDREEIADERQAEPPAPPPPPMVLTDEQRAAEAAYAELQERVARDVRSQLADQHAALRSACWKHAGGATSADFSVNASFDAAGNVVGVGISESRGPDGAQAAGVGQCLRQQAIALNIPSPGQGLSVDVPLHFP